MSTPTPPAPPAAAVPEADGAGAAPVAPPQPQPVAAVSAPAPVAAADAPVVPKQEPAAAPAPAPVAAPVPAPAPAPASTPASHRSNAMNSLPIRAYLDQTVVPILLDGEYEIISMLMLLVLFRTVYAWGETRLAVSVCVDDYPLRWW